MPWAKLDDRFCDHAKVDALLEASEPRGAAALGVWVVMLSHSARQSTNGEVSRRALARYFPGQGTDLAALLVTHGLWDEHEAGWSIRGYLDCNPSRADVERQRQTEADRKKAARQRSKSKQATARVRPDVPADVPPDVPPDVRPDNPADVARASESPVPVPVPSRPVPTRPTPTAGASPAVGDRARADDAVNAPSANSRTTSPPIAEEKNEPVELAEHIRGRLQGGIDGLTNEEPNKAPTLDAIRAAHAKHNPTDEEAIAAAVEARSIVQALNRAPNITGLYAKTLAEHARKATR